jgi:hypothetical protein
MHRDRSRLENQDQVKKTPEKHPLLLGMKATKPTAPRLVRYKALAHLIAQVPQVLQAANQVTLRALTEGEAKLKPVSAGLAGCKCSRDDIGII